MREVRSRETESMSLTCKIKLAIKSRVSLDPLTNLMFIWLLVRWFWAKGEHFINPEKGQREFKCLNLSSLLHWSPFYNVEMWAPYFQAKLKEYLWYLHSRNTNIVVLIDVGINFILILNSEESNMNAYLLKERFYFKFKYL